MQQYTCNTTGAQQWKLVALGNGVYKLLSRNAGLPLDVKDWGQTNGTGVQVATDNGGSAQQWTLERLDGGATSPPTPTPTGGPWRERILNADGSINWSEYAWVANHYNAPDMIDYRFGPKYENLHTSPEDLPALWGPSGDGLIGGQACDDFRQGIDGQDWYAMSGQMTFAPDAGAPSALQAGVVRARNGSTYTLSKYTPAYCFDLRFSWTPDNANSYNTSPDPATLSDAYRKASGGRVPAPPVATVRPKGDGGVTVFLVYQNGLIGLTGTGNDGYVGSGNNEPDVAIRLPSGKVPAATVHNEFLLVTVWDAAQHKGQVAVIAVKGRVKANQTQWLYGFPSWPTVRGLKLLGFVDLPFAAPMHISVSYDLKQGSSRNASENKGLDLGQQAQRDAWDQETDASNPYLNRRLAKSGYAVVTSRAENKVALIDLPPLFASYRRMDLTTQERYEQTNNEGAAEEQWPFTFSQAPEQPQVTQMLDVPQPSVAVAGLPRHAFYWRGDGDVFKDNVYIASLDGTVRVYKVGGLITPEPATPLGAPFKTFTVGRNPSAVDYGEVGVDADDLFFTSRGDRSVSYVLADGSVYATLRDARLRDPVSATVSHNIRSSGNALILSVMDFGGKQVVNHRYDNRRGQDTVAVGPDGQSVFGYGSATPVPGKPFMSTLAEVP